MKTTQPLDDVNESAALVFGSSCQNARMLLALLAEEEQRAEVATAEEEQGISQREKPITATIATQQKANGKAAVTTCKCGSTTHRRVTHNECTLRPKVLNPAKVSSTATQADATVIPSTTSAVTDSVQKAPDILFLIWGLRSTR